MCLSVSSVWAQGATTSLGKVATDVTAIQNLESGYYVIHATAENHQCYIYYSGNTKTAAEGVIRMYRGSVNTDTIGTHGSLAYVWYVSVSADKKRMTIQCAGNGAFWPKQAADLDHNMSTAKTFDNAAVYNYPESDANESGIRLYQEGVKISNKDVYIHKSNFNDTEFKLGYWNSEGKPNGTESACCFKFYKVTPAADITTQATPVALFKYKQQIAGKETGVVADVKVLAGSQTVNPWTEYSEGLYTPTLSVAETTVDMGDVDVNFAEKDYVKTDTYYRLFVPRTDYNVHVYSTKNTTETSSKNNFTEYYNPQAFWKFEKDGLQVKMVCADGTYVKATQPGNGLNTAVTFVTDASQASKFYLKGKPSNYSGANGFSLKFSNNTYLGDHSSWHLGVWNSNNTESSTNEGSCFVIEDTFLPNEVYANLSHRATFISGIPTTDPSLLRVYTTASAADFGEALTAAGENVYGLTINDLLEIYKKGFAAHPDENAYYRIKNLGTESNIYPSTINCAANTDGVVPSTNDNARVIELKTESDAMAPQLWQFVANADGTFKIKNANTNCAWANQTDTGKNFDMTTAEHTDEYAGNFNIVAVPEKSQQVGETIASVNDRVSTFLLCNGRSAVMSTGSNLQLAASNVTFSNAENYWQIEKVENFDVTISNAKYATVGYPFPVQVTNTNVKVYYATKAANGILKLTEATDNIIPANEGAILYCESGATNANMKILSSTESTFADNKLTATTAKRTGFATKTTYGLSYKNNLVSFRLNTDDYVPANKSYLLASKYSNTTAGGNAQQLLFSFDNVVEGIDNAVVDGQNANKVYYDLQGRRVMYPAHGIFVTENGEKVFIK